MYMFTGLYKYVSVYTQEDFIEDYGPRLAYRECQICLGSIVSLFANYYMWNSQVFIQMRTQVKIENLVKIENGRFTYIY